MLWLSHFLHKIFQKLIQKILKWAFIVENAVIFSLTVGLAECKVGKNGSRWIIDPLKTQEKESPKPSPAVAAQSALN